jgi:hypothetical protein
VVDSPSPGSASREQSPSGSAPQVDNSPFDSIIRPGSKPVNQTLSAGLGQVVAKSSSSQPKKVDGPAPNAGKIRIAQIPSNIERSITPDSSSFQAISKLGPKRKAPTEPPRPSSVASSSRLPPPPAPAQPEVITMSYIRTLISADALLKAKPGALFKFLRPRVVKGEELPPQLQPNPIQLKEILQQLKNHAGVEYLREMADNEKYTLVFRNWLKTILKDPELWEPAITPILMVGHLCRVSSHTDK